MRVEAVVTEMDTLQTDDYGRTFYTDLPGDGWYVVSVVSVYHNKLSVVVARRAPEYEFNPNRGEYEVRGDSGHHGGVHSAVPLR